MQCLQRLLFAQAPQEVDQADQDLGSKRHPPTKNFVIKRKKNKHVRFSKNLVVICVMRKCMRSCKQHNQRSNIFVKHNVLVNRQKIVDPSSAQKRQEISKHRNQNESTVEFERVCTSSSNCNTLTKSSIGLKRN